MSAFDVIQSCGITTAGVRTVVTAEGALTAARQAGYPVVLKGAGPALLHKTESKAVFTELASEEAVTRAFHALKRRVTHAVLVQPHIRDGVEMFAGAVADPQFGHLVMGGSGGTMLELLRDTACRLAPLTDVDATEIIDSLKSARLLRGISRSRRPPTSGRCATRACSGCRCLSRPARPSRKSISNPVRVLAHGALVLDARVRVRVVAATSGPGASVKSTIKELKVIWTR